ncbi:hypothetical protein AN958_11224 [Leucoagaricus sp. SymC.cos]|nr:hypothetical protein AN958_11224 [Leucoagaricus sp. SymC.cos]
MPPFDNGQKRKNTKKGTISRIHTKEEKDPEIDLDLSDLPPIHDIRAIFADLVSRAPKVAKTVLHIQGRKLRVATMCSGTESPLLALEFIQKSIREQHGLELEIEHVFSCEIEPFKQAYIERNFRPPILFRDICELGETEAHTAYGALVPVPGDVDLLVAGTSCVDFSNLNMHKKNLNDDGESGQTLRGLISWITNHRPPVVILENVCSAPWAAIKELFKSKQYTVETIVLDTKCYYIPQTRNRTYLIAIDRIKSNYPAAWAALVKKLARPASSPMDDFLLPSDDPHIHQARKRLVQECRASNRGAGADWSRCEARHQHARLDEGLGQKRPLTSWDEGGFCKLPDFAWNDWGVGQTERVLDLMEISLLRSSMRGIDPNYKTYSSQIWNLSQNVDRNIDSTRPGLSPCLTPSMIPYITNRGGLMVGLEALALQGLPVDQLLLSHETEGQLIDLAGNAMSTPVIGACILAVLVFGNHLFKAGDDIESYEFKNNIIDPGMLQFKPLSLSGHDEYDVTLLLSKAERSSRLCICEGHSDITVHKLYQCMDCMSTFCEKCQGKPEHNPRQINIPRILPAQFAKTLKEILPMCLSIMNVSAELLEGLRANVNLVIPDAQWKKWCNAVLGASGHDLQFVECKRQEIWSIIYKSPFAKLELSLYPQKPEWRLFAFPEDKEQANADI